jgi:hypothetical protein
VSTEEQKRVKQVNIGSIEMDFCTKKRVASNQKSQLMLEWEF